MGISSTLTAHPVFVIVYRDHQYEPLTKPQIHEVIVSWPLQRRVCSVGEIPGEQESMVGPSMSSSQKPCCKGEIA